MSLGAEQPVDCVIVHFGDPNPTVALAVSVAKRPDTKIFLVDNSANLPATLPPGSARVESKGNVGFGAGVNLAAEQSSAPFLLVLNPDTQITALEIDALVHALLADPSLAAVGPSLAYPDGRRQLNGGSFSGWPAEAMRVTGQGHRLRRVRSRLRREPDIQSGLIRRDWLSAAAILLRRSAFAAVGGFDPGFFLYFEDEDICRRLRAAGWEVALVSSPVVVHAVGAASRQTARYRHPAYEASRMYYHSRHSGAVLHALVRASARHRLSQLSRSTSD